MPHAIYIPYGVRDTALPCNDFICMKILIDALGIEGARRFLEHSLPLVRQRNLDLLESLVSGNWEQAAKQAHSIKGTANLYAHPALIECLENIIHKNLTHILSKEFTTLLQTEQRQAELSILAFLSEK